MTNGISCSATRISPRPCSADCGTSAKPSASTDLPCVSLKANHLPFPELSAKSSNPRYPPAAYLVIRCRPCIAVMNLALSCDPREGHFKRAQVGHSWKAARGNRTKEEKSGCNYEES